MNLIFLLIDCFCTLINTGFHFPTERGRISPMKIETRKEEWNTLRGKREHQISYTNIFALLNIKYFLSNLLSTPIFQFDLTEEYAQYSWFHKFVYSRLHICYKIQIPMNSGCILLTNRHLSHPTNALYQYITFCQILSIPFLYICFLFILFFVWKKRRGREGGGVAAACYKTNCL